MRRFLLVMLFLGAFPCIMFAQSFFGNYGSNNAKTPVAKRGTTGGLVPAPIPAIATPQQFNASITQAAQQDRVTTQYQEALAKQPPLVKGSSLPQPSKPMVPPPTSTTSVSTTTTPPPSPPVMPAQPTASQVQIERAPATTTTTSTQTTSPAPDTQLQPPAPTQTQVYTGFQGPQQNNQQPGGNVPGQNTNQGGWKIKY